MRELATEVPTTPTFEALYADLREPMVRVAYLSIGSLAIAEEIVQEAFIRLHRHLDTVENAGGFMRVTVVRLCATWHGRAAMESERIRGIVEPTSTGNPEIDETWKLVAGLRPDRRIVLVLRYYEDLSYQEIARLVGRPVATVRTQVWRALRELRKELEP